MSGCFTTTKAPNFNSKTYDTLNSNKIYISCNINIILKRKWINIKAALDVESQ